jgi:death-on-curing protein
MSEPVWLNRRALELLHDESIAEHGGAAGLSDEGLLESALARPRNLHIYERVTDPARLAASYAFGLAKNHAFVDGNKRIAFIAAVLFLRLNGFRLTAEQAEATLVMLSVASGAMSEKKLTSWIRKHLRKIWFFAAKLRAGRWLRRSQKAVPTLVVEEEADRNVAVIQARGICPLRRAGRVELHETAVCHP